MTKTDRWQRRGDAIRGEGEGNSDSDANSAHPTRHGLALSADCSVLVVGRSGSNVVEVREYNEEGSGTWDVLGQLSPPPSGDIGDDEERFGHSVSISGDGTQVFVGAPTYGKGRGRAFAYVRRQGVSDGGTEQWEPLGNPIFTDLDPDDYGAGADADCNGDGSPVAIGADGMGSNADGGTRIKIGRGSVRLFRYDDAVSDWVRVRDDGIVGGAAELNAKNVGNEQFSASVSISDGSGGDGHPIVAVGAPNRGVYVFRRNYS